MAEGNRLAEDRATIGTGDLGYVADHDRAHPVHGRHPAGELDDLRQRLRRTRWPADPGNPDGRYGATRGVDGRPRHHWASSLRLAGRRGADERLRSPAGRASTACPIHFLRVPGKGPNPMPLVLTHGWPWTFWDLHKVVDPLADPAAHGGDPADSFDVIVPSLPGYGFSVPLSTTGVDVARIAELWVELMRDVLGYDRFGAQGGDWGAFVTGQLGHAHAEHLIGVYLTMPVIPGLIGQRAPDAPTSSPPTSSGCWPASDEARRVIEAHVAVHRRDPQTFAYAMADSPAGLGAWLWHRRQLWCDGDALEVFGRDDLCTLASLYWFNTLVRLVDPALRRAVHQAAGAGARPGPDHRRADRLRRVPQGAAVPAPRRGRARTPTCAAGPCSTAAATSRPAERPDAVVDELRAFFRDLR